MSVLRKIILSSRKGLRVHVADSGQTLCGWSALGCETLMDWVGCTCKVCLEKLKRTQQGGNT